jgi:hypothetical protein
MFFLSMSFEMKSWDDALAFILQIFFGHFYGPLGPRDLYKSLLIAFLGRL